MQELDQKDAEAAKMQEEIRRRNTGVTVPTKAPKKPRKNNAVRGPAATATDADVSTSTTTETGNCCFLVKNVDYIDDA